MLDLSRQHEDVADEIWHRVREVAESQAFVLGETVAAFERALADVHGVTHAVGVNSGTDALELTLRALDVGEGDEVVTSPFTFFATANDCQFMLYEAGMTATSSVTRAEEGR